MSALGWVNDISLLVHVLSVVGILVLMLSQLTKSPRVIPVGTLHAALTALVAGGIMMGIRGALHNQDAKKWEEFDEAKFGIKFLILAVILYLLFKFQKAKEVTTAVWFSILGLTIVNILIAVLW